VFEIKDRTMENIRNYGNYMSQEDLIFKSTTKAEILVNGLCKWSPVGDSR
jgi:hypothetical protein